MAVREIRIAMDGATGRLCRTQHLIQSVLAIRSAGGVELPDGDKIVPVPVLVGRNPQKLEALAQAHDLQWSTDRDACLSDPTIEIYFDAGLTGARADRAGQAIAAGKHIYLEKPVAASSREALDLVHRADAAGLKHGTVQDKLFLPGIRTLIRLARADFFGPIFSIRIAFGWWVFDGGFATAQRPSWNYRKDQGGGLILDMFPHWRYIIEHIVAPIRSVSCRAETRVRERWDEAGRPFKVDVEDEAFALFELECGALARVDNSWAARVKRDDLLTIHVDGAKGSAVAGLHQCFAQPLVATPKPGWNIEAPEPASLDEDWEPVPATDPPCNGYRRGWELFLAHVAADAPFEHSLLEGVKGLQLVDACYRSHEERRWIDLPQLDAMAAGGARGTPR